MQTVQQGSPSASAVPTDTMVGTMVADKYELIRLVGQGGMGAVYEGRNSSTLKRCAVKILLSPELAQTPQVVKRFFREARASSVIESDHIVQVFDSGSDNKTGFPYMVMELLNGEDLEHTLRNFGALQPLAAAKLILQASIGLAKAHEQSIVHRDIKPANLYLTRRENGDLVVKILDFGIAKVKMEKFSETSSGMTREGSMLGTPLYMSPEQAKGAADIDVRSDVWSLGVVLYELLCGSLPYGDATSLGELMVSIITADIPLLQDKAPWVPPELAEICHRAISRDISKRFQNAGQLRDALNAIVPDGGRMTHAMLVGISAEQRAFVAPRLQLTDDGMLRATTRTGLLVTRAPPAQKSNGWLIVAAISGTLLLGGAVTAAIIAGKKNAAEQVTSAPTLVVTSVVQSDSVSVGAVIKRFDLHVVAPDGAEISVDGEKRSLADGKIELAGTPGSTRKIEIKIGEGSEEHLVAITEGGLLPWKIEFKKPTPPPPQGVVAARPAAGGAAKVGAAAAKPAAAPGGEAAKPAKKVQVETGMDEFK